MANLLQIFKRLPLDWGSLVAIVSGIGTVLFIVFNLVSSSATQAQRIETLNEDVTTLKHSIPEIERTLGRIEGKIDIIGNETSK